MFSGFEQDVNKILWGALALAGAFILAMFRWVWPREEKRLDERFGKLASDADQRAEELRARTEDQANQLADEAQRRENELGAFRDRIWEELRGLRDGMQDISRSNDVAHAEIRGCINTLSSSVDLRIKAVEQTMATSLQAVERKMPNGTLERLAAAFETISKRLAAIEGK